MRPRLLFVHVGMEQYKMSVRDFFLLFFPKLDDTVEFTNEQARAVWNGNWSDMDRREFERWLGIAINKCRYPDMSMPDYFRESHVYGVNPGPQMARYMSLRRFNHIKLALCFQSPTFIGKDEDPWWRVTKFMQDFNSLRELSISPGWMLCIDETMVKWRGQGLPWLAWVPRKPEEHGVEMWTVADTATGIMMHMDLNKGRELNKEKDF